MRPGNWSERLFAIARPVLARLWLVTRGMTLGVRGVVVDAEGRVLLVRHGYVPGWHFPGGGVEVGETLHAALARELHEEANVTLSAPAGLHGVFLQTSFSRRDHVAVFVVRHFAWAGARPANREIAECGFFARDALPDNVSPATRRRLAEILDGVPPAGEW